MYMCIYVYGLFEQRFIGKVVTKQTRICTIIYVRSTRKIYILFKIEDSEIFRTEMMTKFATRSFEPSFSFLFPFSFFSLFFRRSMRASVTR